MKGQKIHIALFAGYVLLMLWLLFDRPGYAEGIPYWEQVRANLNLAPFQTVRLYARLLTDGRPHLVRTAAINLFGNVVMFIPLGFLLPPVFSKLRNLWKVLLTTAAAISLVEVIQLFTLVGSCDIDDLILNLLGAAMGYGLYKMCK